MIKNKKYKKGMHPNSHGPQCGFQKGQFPGNKFEKGNKFAFQKGNDPWNKNLTKETDERIKRYGEKMSNELHWKWKGDEVEYRALHAWVERQLGKPTKCEHCDKDNLVGQQINWANKSGEYKRDITDWIRLCVKCHRKYDNQLKKQYGNK